MGLTDSELRRGSWGGVDVLRGHLGCDFDDAGFVDDPCRAVAFLHDAYDPRLMTLAVFGRFDLGAKTGGLLTRKTDQQTSYTADRKIPNSSINISASRVLEPTASLSETKETKMCD